MKIILQLLLLSLKEVVTKCCRWRKKVDKFCRNAALQK